jgi:SH3-like domain-containing protein
MTATVSGIARTGAGWLAATALTAALAAALGAGPVGAESTVRPQARSAVAQTEPPEVQGPVTEIAAPAAPRVAGGSGRPLPRFASLKAQQGNVRRGPHYDHRIDWVFVRPGMPLRITAEYEHWRRVEDSEGAGGWIHYSLLSVARTVQVVEDLAEIRTRADPRAPVIARAEMGVIARVTACTPDWCRISRDGVRGWLPKAALWGVTADETFD